MKKILMILAPNTFRDLEYIVPRAFFEAVDFEVTTTSTELLSVWRFGFKVNHKWLIKDYKNQDFDAIVFVWWIWSLDLVSNDDLKEMTFDYLNSGKIVASICAAPRNLLEWWVAKWRKLTWNNWDNNFENLAKEHWAIADIKDIVLDWNLITWYWPEAVESFSNAIIESLNN